MQEIRCLFAQFFISLLEVNLIDIGFVLSHIAILSGNLFPISNLLAYMTLDRFQCK